MIEQIVSEAIKNIEGIVFIALMSIITIKVKDLSAYLKAKKELTAKNIGNANYNMYYGIAKDVFNIVEEGFRNSKVVEGFTSKIDYFDNLITKKIPGITQDEIDYFRQAISGEVNNLVKGSGILEPADEEPKIEMKDSQPAPSYVEPSSTVTNYTDITK